MSLLSASSISVRYGDHVAVNDVSLDVDGGQLVAVTGTSGAGKTSLLGALSGTLARAGGTVRVGDQLVTDHDSAFARGVVIVPQGNWLVRALTAAENLALAAAVSRPLMSEARAEVLAALTRVGLDDAGAQLVDELSGGQQQRLAVARALVQRGRVVLADEPTSELDSTNRDAVVSALREQARRGAAVIMATHDPDAAAQCDAELHLEAGRATWPRDDRR